MTSGVVAILELWERSEVLFPSFSLHSFWLPLLFPPFLYLPSPPSSGGNNFNDFPDNQLTIHFAFLCKPAWGNPIVSPFSLVLLSFMGTAFPTKYLGERRSLSTTPLVMNCGNNFEHAMIC